MSNAQWGSEGAFGFEIKLPFYLEYKLDFEWQITCLLKNEESNYKLHFLQVLPGKGREDATS